MPYDLQAQRGDTRTRWSLAAVIVVGVAFGSTSARGAVTERISVSTGGDEANGDSASARITPDSGITGRPRKSPRAIHRDRRNRGLDGPG